MRDILWPTDTYTKKNRTDCWATDAAHVNGKYFFYLSVGGNTVGVVSSASPVGPWKDPLGKALIPSDMPDLPGDQVFIIIAGSLD